MKYVALYFCNFKCEGSNYLCWLFSNLMNTNMKCLWSLLHVFSGESFCLYVKVYRSIIIQTECRSLSRRPLIKVGFIWIVLRCGLAYLPGIHPATAKISVYYFSLQKSNFLGTRRHLGTLDCVSQLSRCSHWSIYSSVTIQTASCDPGNFTYRWLSLSMTTDFYVVYLNASICIEALGCKPNLTITLRINLLISSNYWHSREYDMTYVHNQQSLRSPPEMPLGKSSKRCPVVTFVI